MLHGCWSEKLGPVQIELSGGRLVDTNRRDAIIHRPRDFGKIVPVRLHGVPTTDALRTLTDLGQVVTDDVLRSTIFAFLRKRKVTIPGLKAVATHRSARGRVGASAVIRVLARNVSDAGFTASELEYEVLEAVSTAGLPAPMLNFRIVIGGQTYLVDLAWPEFRVAAELDSAEFHADQFDEDRERDVNLKLAGWEVHRFTWKHATQKRQWMVNAMLETLRSRGLAA